MLAATCNRFTTGSDKTPTLADTVASAVGSAKKDLVMSTTPSSVDSVYNPFGTSTIMTAGGSYPTTTDSLYQINPFAGAWRQQSTGSGACWPWPADPVTLSLPNTTNSSFGFPPPSGYAAPIGSELTGNSFFSQNSSTLTGLLHSNATTTRNVGKSRYPPGRSNCECPECKQVCPHIAEDMSLSKFEPRDG